MSAIDKIKKPLNYILLENNTAYTDSSGNIIFFKSKEEAEKYIKKEKIDGIVK